MRILSRADLHARCVQEMGLDSEATDLTSREAVAALLRHAASLLCPCPPRKISSAVRDALRGVLEDSDGLKELVEDVLDAVVGYGDLIEQFPIDSKESA